MGQGPDGGQGPGSDGPQPGGGLDGGPDGGQMPPPPTSQISNLQFIPALLCASARSAAIWTAPSIPKGLRHSAQRLARFRERLPWDTRP
jgi:hypothetical protein